MKNLQLDKSFESSFEEEHSYNIRVWEQTQGKNSDQEPTYQRKYSLHFSLPRVLMQPWEAGDLMDLTGWIEILLS